MYRTHPGNHRIVWRDHFSDGAKETGSWHPHSAGRQQGGYPAVNPGQRDEDDRARNGRRPCPGIRPVPSLIEFTVSGWASRRRNVLCVDAAADCRNGCRISDSGSGSHANGSNHYIAHRIAAFFRHISGRRLYEVSATESKEAGERQNQPFRYLPSPPQRFSAQGNQMSAYSVRSAFIGSRRAAFQAGTIQAASATTRSSPTTEPNTSASSGCVS